MKSTAIKVVLIDDCPEDREMYRRFLQKSMPDNFQIVEASSGADGLECCKREQPDCVLIDYPVSYTHLTLPTTPYV